MKKILLCALTATILLTSLASCSRRNQYEDHLGSEKETQEEETAKDGIFGSPSEDYTLTVIKKSGNSTHYGGMTDTELRELYAQSGNRYNTPVMPTGMKYDVRVDNGNKRFFYNKLTGNLGSWCSDPLCMGGDSCFWSNTWYEIQYVSETHLYFLSSEGHLYRSDWQRNNLELIYEVPVFEEEDLGDGAGFIYAESVEVMYEQNGILYIVGQEYEMNKGSLFAWKAIDLATKEIQTVYVGEANLDVLSVVDGTVYYTYGLMKKEDMHVYKTDLAFSDVSDESEPLLEKAGFSGQFNDRYALLYDHSRMVKGMYPLFLYDLKTNTKLMDLPSENGEINFHLSGDYIYFEDEITKDEAIGDPLRDYFTYTWDEERVIGDGKTVLDRNLSADTQGAGRIYRLHIPTGEIECVLELKYKDVPVRIGREFYVDGEVIYFSFHNYEEFKNYLNMDFDRKSEPEPHYAVADLQNGTVTFLDFSDEESA
ncbi:MAG: hypothetical protein IJD38_03530 [Clostridia bacterium]|nr:hypothetical protein [Clostridia bacterium]